MKIDAQIEWVIDDNVLGITSGTSTTVTVDSDYVSADEDEIVQWIENELAEHFGISLIRAKSEDVNGDFVIKNLSEVLEELKYEEYIEKIDPGYEV